MQKATADSIKLLNEAAPTDPVIRLRALEAFAAAADWALYHLGLQRVVAKCFKENEASRRMLSSCMRPNGEDDTYYYFEKLV